MAKRFERDKNNKKLERTIVRNWVICGISAVLIIVLLLVSR